MNAKLQQQTPVINSWLDNADKQLKAVGIQSAQLDAELILAEIIGKNRTFLHAHSEQIICSKHLKKANLYLEKRLKRIPLAYIFGYKEFYGRNFKVNQNTLIPRPESEAVIEILRKILSSYKKNNIKLLDIGTGSGCLGITTKLEFPSLDVKLIDISQKALSVAKSNTKALKATVKMLRSDLLDKINSKVDIIIANLPYVDKSWEVSPEVKFEPIIALYANDDGQELIKKLIIQSTKKLTKNGYLILEADPTQHKSLIDYAKIHYFTLVSKSGYIISLKYTK